MKLNTENNRVECFIEKVSYVFDDFTGVVGRSFSWSLIIRFNYFVYCLSSLNLVFCYLLYKNIDEF